MGGARRPARQGWWHLRHGGGREMVRNQQFRDRPADRLTGRGRGEESRTAQSFLSQAAGCMAVLGTETKEEQAWSRSPSSILDVV